VLGQDIDVLHKHLLAQCCLGHLAVKKLNVPSHVFDAQRGSKRTPEREARREPQAQLVAVRLTVGLDSGWLIVELGVLVEVNLAGLYREGGLLLARKNRCIFAKP
jgi:hypothetical protein